MNYTADSLEQNVEYFSRRLDPIYFERALKIYQHLVNETNYKGKLLVRTYELYDKAFTFDRVRRYDSVQQNMDMLEHFEDNLNINISNKQAFSNFLRVATTVRKNFLEAYHDSGAF